MPGTVPPTPAAIEVVTQVVYYLSLSLPLGIGLTVATLAVAESEGGLVSRRARSVAVPAAVVVLLGITLQWRAAAHVTGLTLLQFIVMAISGCALVAMRWTASRLVACGSVVGAIAAAVIPHIPLQRSTPSRIASNALTAVHVLGAITWVGGLVALAATAIVQRRNAFAVEDRDRIAADWARIWDRFSMVAMLAVGALIVSGTWMTWSRVGTASQLLTTPYGRFLAVKLVLVLVLLGAGAYNVRVLLPKIHSLQRNGDAGGVFRLAAQHFPLVVWGESLLALGVLVVVPFLRGSARSEAGWPSAAAFDVDAFGTGLVLIAIVASAMWLGSRRSFRPFEPSTPAL